MGMEAGIIVISLLVGVLFILFIISVMKTHRLVVRSPDSNRIIGYYWINLKIDKKDGSRWWKSIFFQKKILLPEPPDKVVSINPKGKCFVEVYQLSDEEYIYIQPSKLQKDSKLVTGGTVGEMFKPFSVVPRQVIINKFVQSEKLRQHSWIKENGMNLICVGFMAMIIIMGMVYAGEIFQGINKVQGGASSMVSEATKMLNSFKSGTVDIIGETKGGLVQQGTEEPPE